VPILLHNTRQHAACQGDFYLQDTTSGNQHTATSS
jgi:hypothetical protein